MFHVLSYLNQCILGNTGCTLAKDNDIINSEKLISDKFIHLWRLCVLIYWSYVTLCAKLRDCYVFMVLQIVSPAQAKYNSLVVIYFHGCYFHCTLSRINIRIRIVGGQWRHKITIYGNGLSVYIHKWPICDVTNRQLFTRGYYYSMRSFICKSDLAFWFYDWKPPPPLPKIPLSSVTSYFTFGHKQANNSKTDLDIHLGNVLEIQVGIFTLDMPYWRKISSRARLRSKYSNVPCGVCTRATMKPLYQQPTWKGKICFTKMRTKSWHSYILDRGHP